MKPTYYSYPGLSKNLKPEDIIETACKTFDMPLEVMQKRTRVRTIAEKRHVLINLLCNYTQLKLEQIGAIFGVDHSVVIYSRKNASDEGCKQIAALRHTVEEKIKSNFQTVKNFQP